MIKHLEDTALIIPRMAPGLESLAYRGSASVENDDTAIQKTCQQFEAFFIYYLLKVMRQSIPKTNIIDGGRGEEIYQSLMDQEMANKLASSGGIGLAGLLLDRLRPSSIDEAKDISKKNEISIIDDKPSFSLPIQGGLNSPYGMDAD